jgi:hypothetical protein
VQRQSAGTYRQPGATGEISLWLIVFYALIMLFSWLGSFGGTNEIAHPWDTVLVAVMSLGIYYWGARSCLPRLILAETKKSRGEGHGNGNPVVTRSLCAGDAGAER